MARDWTDDVRSETERLLKAYGIKQKKYHHIVWDSRGHVVEYQETPESPTYVRKYTAEGVVDTVKKEKAPRKKRGASSAKENEK